LNEGIIDSIIVEALSVVVILLLENLGELKFSLDNRLLVLVFFKVHERSFLIDKSGRVEKLRIIRV
jgi:hypothetical protein